MSQSTTHSVSPRRINWVGCIPFFGMHALAVFGVAYWGFSWKGLALALALYAVRMFGVTAGYHRYFAHRAYKTSRVGQLLLAFLAQTSAQKGALWWAAHHRNHHRLSDQPGDLHSVKQDGFWYSHVGWILTRENDETDYAKIYDFAKYPELVWLNKNYLVPPVALSVLLYLVGGVPALFWGMCVSTVLLWHGTFTINSLTHVFGSRRYETTDNSKNNLWLALITSGEGWHNNHHYYQRAVNQGFYWWEIDTTFYALWLMSKVGLVWDLHVAPRRVRDAHLQAGAEGSPALQAVVEVSAPAARVAALPPA